MKKLIIMVSMAIGMAMFTVACTKTAIQETDEYATPKSKAVNSKGDGSEYEMDNSKV